MNPNSMLASSGIFDGYDSDPDEDIWPNTSIGKDFAALEQTFVCNICKGFIKNAHTLPCLHSFCCHCVAKSFDSASNGKIRAMDGKECPLCRHPCKPNDIKSNDSLATAINYFTSAREELLSLLKLPKQTSSSSLASSSSILDSKVAHYNVEETTLNNRSHLKRARSNKRVHQEEEKNDDDDDSFMHNNHNHNQNRNHNHNHNHNNNEESEYEPNNRRNQDQMSSSSSRSSSSSGGGVSIDKKIASKVFSGKEKETQIKGYLLEICKDSRIKPSNFGSKDVLKRRYKSLVMNINSQVGAPAGSKLTLEQVISKFNQEEANAAILGRMEKQSKDEISGMGVDHTGFSALIKAEKERERERVRAKQQSAGTVGVISSSSSSINVTVVNNNAVTTSKSSPASKPRSKTRHSSNNDNEHENNNDNDSNSMETETLSTPSIEIDDMCVIFHEWVIKYSLNKQRYFFYNRNSCMAQWVKPDHIPDSLLSQIPNAPQTHSQQHSQSQSQSQSQESISSNSIINENNAKKKRKTKKESLNLKESLSSNENTMDLTSTVDNTASDNTTIVVNSATDSSSSWTCEACTIIHKLYADKCSMCETPNSNYRRNTRGSNGGFGTGSSSGSGSGSQRESIFSRMSRR
jgi:hypothetical protein